MADLSDELILEIIVRLPPKYAIQCLLLNKKFFHAISQPIFRRRLLSSSRSCYTSIFSCSGNTFTRINQEISGRISQVSTTLPMELAILASCNGLLLLQFQRYMSQLYYYVFNPITGGIMLVDYPLRGFQFNNIGLAVDHLDAQDFHFKVVVADMKNISDRIIERFIVVVPRSSSRVGPSWSAKSQVEFATGSFTPICFDQPVYAHGCLHWLGKQGNKIVVFDVEKEEARIINGPVNYNKPGSHSVLANKWFGFADGSLQFVYTLRKDIIIQSHNYLKDEWQIKRKIATICIPFNNDVLIGKDLLSGYISLFFDGQRLFVKAHKREEDGVVLMYDILGDTWSKTGKIDARRLDNNQCFLSFFSILSKVSDFFSFFPTLAKVSDKYLHNCKTKIPGMSSIQFLQLLFDENICKIRK